MGERDIFPHVGRRTTLQLQGAREPVYPLVTGTFGGVDFLHSIMGEVSDKATQSEIDQLEGTMETGKRNDDSRLKDILSKIPSGLFGGKDEAAEADQIKANATAAQMNQMRVSPREPEAFTLQMQSICKDIYPVIEWHDNLMRSISEAIEKVPILPELLEQFEEYLNRYVFSLIAPFVLPVIGQIKSELSTGSSEVIQSSKREQHIVFDDDQSTDPTHSMLSKDHFSNASFLSNRVDFAHRFPRFSMNLLARLHLLSLPGSFPRSLPVSTMSRSMLIERSIASSRASSTILHSDSMVKMALRTVAGPCSASSSSGGAPRTVRSRISSDVNSAEKACAMARITRRVSTTLVTAVASPWV